MKNNIFKFATSELSQDAFICWLANGFNCDNEQLKQLAIEFVKKVSGESEIRKVEIKHQYKKIDVLLLVNDTVAVIIEDKTFTGEHDEQIKKYKDTIMNEPLYKNYKVRIVFLKTGFMYDNDRLTAKKVMDADGTVIDRKTLKDILFKYNGKCNSEILDDYYKSLTDLDEWYITYGDFRKITEDSHWEWNIAKNQIAQYNLMREFFPDEENEYIYHGSSSGRPWTEHVIHEGKCEEYSLFWRIDTDNKGPYVSLRIYPSDNWFDKKDDRKKQINGDRYIKYFETTKQYFKQAQDIPGWTWDDIYPGWRGGCREAAIITYHLNDALKDWDNLGKVVVQNVRKITEDFVGDICPKVDEEMKVNENAI